jgi:hypothetical protein
MINILFQHNPFNGIRRNCRDIFYPDTVVAGGAPVHLIGLSRLELRGHKAVGKGLSAHCNDEPLPGYGPPPGNPKPESRLNPVS